MKARIGVVDDERNMVEVLGMVLRRDGHEVFGFGAGEALLAVHEAEPFDLVLTDLRMPGVDGLEVLARSRVAWPEVPVLLMSAYATLQTAVQALRDGAFDYVQKPFDNHELKTLVRRALEMTRLERENRYLRAQLAHQHGPARVVAESPGMRQVFEVVRRAAATSATVLLTGESGTGKEVVARALHFQSARVGGPFVAVNGGAIAEGLLESELFGHVKGAFTGAHRDHAGVFEQAQGGTLFLDEVAELSLDAQTKLLRVLQEREVRPVGGERVKKVDVRLVAATCKDLQGAVREGRFREDLYFRLAVIPLRLPPLRERPEDVLPLAGRFLLQACARQGRRLQGFDEAVEAHLRAYAWPGNVRELENTVERGVAMAQGERVTMEDLLLDLAPQPLRAGPAPSLGARGEGGAWEGLDEAGTLQDWLDRAAAARIQAALRQTGGGRAEAARVLGVERTTLYRLMRRLGME
jgi:DNA-binding NtrC family response regulator